MSLNLVYKQNGIFQKDQPRYHESAFVGLSESEIQAKFTIQNYDYEIVDTDTLNNLLNAKTDVELLAEAKRQKMIEIETKYQLAQRALFTNGITFGLGLTKDTGLDLLRNACAIAAREGKAYVLVTNINTGNKYHGFVPLEILQKMQSTVEYITEENKDDNARGQSQKNHGIRDALIDAVNASQSVESVNNIIVQYKDIPIININVVCDNLYNNINISQTTKDWLLARRVEVLNANNEFDHFTYNLFIEGIL